jgi:nucleotide-binding universal stress UspA family protein
MYRNILVPIDGSDTANQGLSEAIKLAKALGSRIRLIHITNELDGVPSDLHGFDIRSIAPRLRHDAEAILARAQEQVRAEAIEVDTRVVEAWGGQAGDEVVQHAKEWPADLIVCGTHGRRGIRRIVMGSDAEFTLRHSPAPVLLVRSQTAHERR